MFLKSGFLYDKKNSRLVLTDEEKIYNFLSNDIEIYMKNFEVLATDSFRERENPDIEAIKKIIELGADINATDRNGNNILIRAVLFEYDKEDNGIYRVFSTPLEIMEELLKAGANMTQRNIYGNTAYRIAARNKKKDFIELFDKYRK